MTHHVLPLQRDERDKGSLRKKGRVVAFDSRKTRWLRFENPQMVVEANNPGQVMDALAKVENATSRGLWAAGFISYEAAPAFDRALTTHPPRPDLPLLWFGLYNAPQPLDALPSADRDAFSVGPWRESLSYARYQAHIAAIKARIARGDTYQVNYTMRLRADFQGDPWAFFLALQAAQRHHYAAYIDLGERVICSASPELFFELRGESLRAKPMKGTMPRGRTWEEDEANRRRLHHSEKDRAENVMIVDMMRNDMGRVAEIGTVHVPRLFEVERRPTVLQMTSTVTARTSASIPRLFQALFPCASITGAPKASTMRIIAELEPEPRGVYTGAIGFLAPAASRAERYAQFNVAIRTALIDRERGQIEYGVGGGVVWDSEPEAEFEECRTKAAVLTRAEVEFDLLESLLWEAGKGYFLLAEHLDRLEKSAAYFLFPFNRAAVRARLLALAASLPLRDHKVRLLISQNGSIRVEADPIAPIPGAGKPWRVGLAAQPVDSSNPFLYHKTTHRAVYEQALANRPDCDEVILWNERGEITEATRANVVVRLDDRLYTPPLKSGLLAGVFRNHLLASGMIQERKIEKDDLWRAQEVCLINSVRRWMPVEAVLT
ncbi:MAG: aminodeoxychorismate synthase component I [Chloroflexi bacterium]|nr:aminodeoxychorismate synthase component I [Chloroflexota bacterium]